MKFCPECGSSLDGNMKFCPACGLNLQNQSGLVPTQSVPAAGSAVQPAIQQQPPVQVVDLTPVGEQPQCNSGLVPAGSVQVAEPAVRLATQQQPPVRVIDVTPLEERPQYREALKYERKAKDKFTFSAIYAAICVLGFIFDGIWGLLCWFFAFPMAVVTFFWGRSNKRKSEELKEMSAQEYNAELQKREQRKREMMEFAGGVASGLVQGYINAKRQRY